MQDAPQLPNALPEDWASALSDFNATQLNTALKKAYQTSDAIFPPVDLLFQAFKLTPFNKVKAVWLGQDPYHEPEQAMGVAFAVPDYVKMPPSLKNIFKEYETDLHKPAPASSTLHPWAENGVLLLNTALTVQAHKAGSHRNLGWQTFTRAVLKAVSASPSPKAFILLGNDAQSFEDAIAPGHVIFKAAHPSPLSAYRGFFGCHLFTEVNRLLQEKGASPIAW